MSSSAKKSGPVGSGQKPDKNENSSNAGTGSKTDSLTSTPSKATKHGGSKKSGTNQASNKNSDSQGNNPAILNQQALESLYSATYVEDFIDCNDNVGDDLIRQTTRMFEMGSNYMTYIRELESAMAVLLGENDDDHIIPDQLSSDKKKAVFRLQQVLMTSQDTGDDSLQVMQSIQDYLENKTRQLDVDRKNLAEFCKEQDTPDTPFKDPPPPPTERNIKRARRQRHEIYRPSILGPSSLKATSYPESVASNTRERDRGRDRDRERDHDHQESPAVTPTRSRDSQNQSSSSTPTTTQPAANAQPNADGSTTAVTTTEEPKSNGRSSERSVGSMTRNSTSNSLERASREDRDQTSSTTEKSGGNNGGGGSGNTSSSSVSKKQSLKNQTTQEKKTKKRKAKQSSGNSNSKDDSSPQQYAIDPDEPTYCLCDQVSYGEMIGCDNDLCPIEWFHFSCVSLTTKPKGKWYCPKCRGDRPNVMKPRHIFLKELEKYNKEKEEKA